MENTQSYLYLGSDQFYNDVVFYTMYIYMYEVYMLKASFEI